MGYQNNKIINPEADVSTTLKIQKGSLNELYIGKNFFWSETPDVTDSITFKFNEPIDLKKFVEDSLEVKQKLNS